MEPDTLEEAVPIVLKLNFRTRRKLRVIVWKKSESQFFHESTPLVLLVDPDEEVEGTKYIGFAKELCGKVVSCSVLPGENVFEGFETQSLRYSISRLFLPNCPFAHSSHIDLYISIYPLVSDTIGFAVPCQHDRLWRNRCENCNKDLSMCESQFSPIIHESFMNHSRMITICLSHGLVFLSFDRQLKDQTVHYRHSVNPSILIRADISSMEEEKIASRLLKVKKVRFSHISIQYSPHYSAKLMMRITVHPFSPIQ